MWQIKKEIKYQIAYMSFDIFFQFTGQNVILQFIFGWSGKNSWCRVFKNGLFIRLDHFCWSQFLITIPHPVSVLQFKFYFTLVFFSLISAYKKKTPVCTWPHPSLFLHPPASVLIFGLFFLPSAVHSQSGRNHGNTRWWSVMRCMWLWPLTLTLVQMCMTDTIRVKLVSQASSAFDFVIFK